MKSIFTKTLLLLALIAGVIGIRPSQAQAQAVTPAVYFLILVPIDLLYSAPDAFRDLIHPFRGDHGTFVSGIIDNLKNELGEDLEAQVNADINQNVPPQKLMFLMHKGPASAALYRAYSMGYKPRADQIPNRTHPAAAE